MFTRKITGQFKKDFKKIKNNNVLVEEFEKIVDVLASGEKLPAKYSDHKLKWEHKDLRECHIRPDLLLVYRIDDSELLLLLLRLWSHSEIF